MKIRVLCCEALARMVYFHAAISKNIIDVEIIRLGLHNTPDLLRSKLQERIDECSNGEYDAIALAYGLCGKSTFGLVSRSIPVVMPKAHDCITLFLGSREKYRDQFENQPGTYWYALDYLQRRENGGTALSLGASELGLDAQKTYAEYVDKYGKDNADYLMTIMGAWQQHYQRAVYVDMGIGDGSEVADQARNDATQHGWTFEQMRGDARLIGKLINGEWDDEFLILKRGQQVVMSYDEEIVQAE